MNTIERRYASQVEPEQAEEDDTYLSFNNPIDEKLLNVQTINSTDLAMKLQGTRFLR